MCKKTVGSNKALPLKTSEHVFLTKFQSNWFQGKKVHNQVLLYPTRVIIGINRVIKIEFF